MAEDVRKHALEMGMCAGTWPGPGMLQGLRCVMHGPCAWWGQRLDIGKRWLWRRTWLPGQEEKANQQLQGLQKLLRARLNL